MSAHLAAAVYDWRSLICESDLAPTTRHVALTLSLHMSVRGDSCYPSIKTLAEETGLSMSTVREHLRSLEEKGWLACEVGGGRRSNRYWATEPAGTRQAPHREPVGTPPAAGDEVSIEDPIEEEPSPAAPSSGKLNIVWDLLVEHFGEPATDSEKGDFGKTVKEVTKAIRDVDIFATDDPEHMRIVRHHVDLRVAAMGDYASHRRLRNQWGELGAKAVSEIQIAGRWGPGNEPPNEPQKACPDCAERDPDPECINCGGTGIDGWVS
jgi:DNA-binding MarR family transcriptional regulator